MKNKVTKILALLMAVAIVCSLAACGKDDGGTTTEQTTAQETTAQQTTAVEVRLTETEIRLALGEAQSQWDGDSAKLTDEMKAAVAMYYKTSGKPVQFKDDGFYFVEDEGATVSNETTLTGETTADGQTTTAAVNKDPSTNAEILAAYTEVMNKAKTDKPAYKKIEYQALPSDKINVEKAGLIVTPLLKLAGNFMTTEDKARKDPSVYTKGDNMNSFPIKDASKGCLLTDVNAIKDANCEVLANGNYKITIILNDEKNPEHYRSGQTKAASNTGNMFAPLSRSDIDPELESGLVKATVKNAKYDLYYYNSTATLTYNPQTKNIVTLDMVTYTRLVMEGKVIGISAKGEGVLEMYLKAYEFGY